MRVKTDVIACLRSRSMVSASQCLVPHHWFSCRFRLCTYLQAKSTHHGLSNLSVPCSSLQKSKESTSSIIPFTSYCKQFLATKEAQEGTLT
jgi:hypothetical protein